MKKIIAGFILGLSTLAGTSFLLNDPVEVKSPAVIADDIVEARKPATLIAVGDIMLGRAVEALMAKYGAGYPFEKIGSALEGADFALGNFEGTIVADHKQTPNGGFRFSFLPEAASVLARNNFRILGLGNNHGYDFGHSGFEETRGYLKENSLIPAGNPYSVSKEYAAIELINGRKFIFLSWNATVSFDREAATETIAALKREHQDGFLIIGMHWGKEYELTQNEQQRSLAHAMIDAGADLILGAHPHVVQGIERYAGTLIFYSLGNFIFDQYFSKDVQEGLMVKARMDDAGMSYELLPIRSVRSQPMLMDEASAAEWLAQLAARSDSGLEAEIRQGLIKINF